MESVRIDPEYFFAIEVDCFLTEKKMLLVQPDTLFGSSEAQPSFAKVFIGWQYEGLLLRVEVLLEDDIKVSYPYIQNGDAIELFIDTRNVKQARTTHRFCHHFFFLPEAVEGISRGEVTRFRTEDTHPLCSNDDLELQVSRTRKGYTAGIFIPKSCLVGYDVQESGRVGFTYRISRSDGQKQCFGYPREIGAIEYYPYLWSTLYLKSGEEK